MKYRSVLAFASAGTLVFLGGCMSATSPLANQAPAGISAGQVGGLALGTGAGALAGNAIGGTKGAIIGGAAGLVTSAVVENAMAKNKAAGIAEAEDKGRREGRAEVFEQMWDDEARSPGKKPGEKASAGSETVVYPAQTIEGVDYAPRKDTAESPSEPAR